MDWLLNATDWLHAYTARWHDTWEIAGAIATTAAVFIAVAGIRREHEATQKAERREAAAIAERDAERAANAAERTKAAQTARRSQATLVVAYPHFKSQKRTAGGYEIGAWELLVENHSAGPVFDVRAEVYFGEEFGNEAEAAVIPPQGERKVPTSEMRPAHEPRGVLYFRDLGGVRWRRYQDGTLTEVDENRQPI